MVGAEELFLSVQRIGYIYVLLNFELCSLAFLDMLSQNHPYKVFFKGFIHGQIIKSFKGEEIPFYKVIYNFSDWKKNNNTNNNYYSRVHIVKQAVLLNISYLVM